MGWRAAGQMGEGQPALHETRPQKQKKKKNLNLHIPKIWPQIYMCICNTSTWRNRTIHNNNEIILVTDITTRLKLIRKQL